MAERSVVVLSGTRTAIGTYGGSLKDVPPTRLAALALGEAVKRSKLEPAQIGQVFFGHVIHTEPRDMYLARVAGVEAGLPIDTPALTLNRLCGSGFQAIVSASQAILLGDTETAVAGGAESMSRAIYGLTGLRWGQRMGNAEAIDWMVGGLSDPFDAVHMGVTAENVAAKYGITRQEQDEFAVESHRRAAAAIANGYFKEQIVPVELKTRKGSTFFDTDEHVRAETTIESVSKLRPAFLKEGSVTAGNASGVNDAGAALVLAEEGFAQKQGLKPLARLVSYAHSGVDPKIMGIGPVPAVQRALAKAGLTIEQIDVVEANEAFAAQALAVAKELRFDPAKTNPNGGGIALGHPISATGALITVKALYELQRIGGRYALITMCIGGGQGIAGIFERI
ncbi:MAG: acetyl-CoA C-acyltransferase family protein [Candidatus Baltobacteraceae bacterium]